MSTIDTKHLRELAEAALTDVDPERWDESLNAWVSFEEAATPDVVISLLDELERLRHWKAEAMQVHTEWEETWVAAGRPGRLGTSKAVGVRDEIERLRGDAEWEYGWRATLDGVEIHKASGFATQEGAEFNSRLWFSARNWGHIIPTHKLIRRRKAGPWGPVEGEET